MDLEKKMKIATWNIDRLRRKSKLGDIISECEKIDTDILVLTEADTRVDLPIYEHNCCCSGKPDDHKLPQYETSIKYADTERRIMIYSKYPFGEMQKTYDRNKTACCVEVQTDNGILLVYGTIIGIHAWQKPFFEEELKGTLDDIKKFTADGYKICCLGDFNCSFADNYFCKKTAREEILKCFSDCNMTLLTKDQPQCIDHIAISNEFVTGKSNSPEEWNQGQKLSDHKGICVTI